MNSLQIKEADQTYYAKTYARSDLCIASGKNATCLSTDGKEYIDFSSGIGVNSLGYSDPQWAQAVASQAGTLNHTSNLYYNEPSAMLVKRLCEITGYRRVFLGNSGAEANEGAIKAARKYSFDQYGEGRDTILTLVNSFHGRTVTTLAATGQENFHKYFFPFTGSFDYVPANQIGALKEKLNGKVCAVMMEFIQGEGGVIPLDPDYAAEVAELCQKHDILLIADEVQTGVGRTGAFLASELYHITPDITTLAKGLGGGLPIGAVLLGEKVENVLGYGDHGSTFGSNPICCAGANVVLERIAKLEFLQEVSRKGKLLQDRLSSLSCVETVTGAGMMIGIKHKTRTAADLCRQCLDNGLIVLTAKDKVRLLPPLTITQEELEKGLDILTDVLER